MEYVQIKRYYKEAVRGRKRKRKRKREKKGSKHNICRNKDEF